MKTCLSDDNPVRSLLFGAFWITVGTWHLACSISGRFPDYGFTWFFFFLLGLAQYGLGGFVLRHGLSYRSERVQKLFEPNW